MQITLLGAALTGHSGLETAALIGGYARTRRWLG
jgi:hypothetical protein